MPHFDICPTKRNCPHETITVFSIWLCELVYRTNLDSHSHTLTPICGVLTQTLLCTVRGSKEDQNSMEESDCMTDLAECVLLLLRQTGLKELLSTVWDNSKAKNLRALRDLKHGKTGCWHHHLHFHYTLLLCPWVKLLTWSDSSTVLQLKDRLPYVLIKGIMMYWYYYQLQAL